MLIGFCSMEYQALAFAVTQIRTAEHLPSPVSPASSDEKGAAETWQGGGLGALRRLETVARLYFVRHSFEFCDAFLLLFLSTLGMLALESLRDLAEDAETLRDVRSTLILSVKGLRDQGQHIHIAAATYRLLLSRLSPEDLSVVQGHAPWNPVDENEPLVAQHIQSQWPLAILGRDCDPEASSLEALASKFHQVSLDEPNTCACEDFQSGSELGLEDRSMETT